MMNEQEKRRPEFRPGAEVVMADGQTWHLAKPRVRFTPGDGPRGYSVRLSGPTTDFQAKVDHLNACEEFRERIAAMPEEESDREWAAHPEMDVLGAQLAVGSDLVLANYDLTADELAEVLQFANDPDDDPEGFELRISILRLSRGHAPKPKAGGSEG